MNPKNNCIEIHTAKYIINNIGTSLFESFDSSIIKDDITKFYSNEENFDRFPFIAVDSDGNFYSLNSTDLNAFRSLDQKGFYRHDFIKNVSDRKYIDNLSKYGILANYDNTIVNIRYLVYRNMTEGYPYLNELIGFYASKNRDVLKDMSKEYNYVFIDKYKNLYCISDKEKERIVESEKFNYLFEEMERLKNER